jgi:hypothetical protein
LTTAGGWNLVGYPADNTHSLNLPDAFVSHNVPLNNFSLVYAYHANDPDQWKRYSTTVPVGNDLGSLTAGWGYWVKVNITSIWHVDY